jgi:hypothetical protein
MEMTSHYQRADRSAVSKDSDASGEMLTPPEAARNEKKFREMNENFCRRLRAAIQAGMECCSVGISTAACTRFPVSNYRPPVLRDGLRSGL